MIAIKQNDTASNYVIILTIIITFDIIIISSFVKVFIRELMSNASDAVERLRLQRSTRELLAGLMEEKPLEIHLETDETNRTLTIRDSGIGMTRDEMERNLGTIAQSGSREFISDLNKQNQNSSDIIGQFGVGFYSIFMVADKVSDMVLLAQRCHYKGGGVFHRGR